MGCGLAAKEGSSKFYGLRNAEMIDKYKIRLVLFVCGGIPFLFLHAIWANAALVAYSLTAGLFGILLLGEYPPLGTRWFWRAIIVIGTIHSAIIVGLIALNLAVPAVNRLPRVLYGLLGVVLILEWRLSLRIIEACEPRNPSSN